MPNLPNNDDGSGVYMPKISVPGVGYAELGSMYFKSTTKFTSVSPKVGSLGAAIITVNGQGFNPETLVHYGNDKLCATITNTPAQITCYAPGSWSSADSSIAFTLKSGSTDFSCTNANSNECDFVPTTSVTPNVATVTKSFSGSEYTLTIDGTLLENADLVTLK